MSTIMHTPLCLLLIHLHFVLSLEMVNIPVGSVFFDKPGILVEPSGTVLHHDDVFHTSIAIRLDNINDIRSTSPNCAQHTSRQEMVSEISTKLLEIMDDIPRAAQLTGEVGCPVSGATCSPAIRSESKHGISKRFVQFPVAAAIFGLSALGMGLYTYLSQSNLRQHQQAIESHMKMMDNHLQTQDTYTEMSVGLYQKNYLRSRIFEQTLKNALCTVQKGEEEHTISLLLSQHLEMLEQNIRSSIRGDVTEFLISRDLLLHRILNKTEMKDSVYKTDPGLFYSSSTSFLTHIDKANKTLYFLIVTPKATLQDVSSIYTTHNLGWVEMDSLHRILVPQEFYFISADSQYHPVTVNRPDCLLRSGIHICHARNSYHTADAQCITHLLEDKALPHCSVQTSTEHKDGCITRHTLSGLLIRGCPHVYTMTNVRGVEIKTKMLFNPAKTSFLAYQNFTTLLVGEHIITSRDTILTAKSFDTSTITTLDLPQMPHLYSSSDTAQLLHFVSDLKKEQEKNSIPIWNETAITFKTLLEVAIVGLVCAVVGVLSWKVFQLNRVNALYHKMSAEISRPIETQELMRSHNPFRRR